MDVFYEIWNYDELIISKLLQYLIILRWISGSTAWKLRQYNLFVTTCRIFIPAKP